MMLTRMRFLLLTGSLLFASGAVLAGTRMGISAQDFDRCGLTVECQPFVACSDDAFGPGDGCFASCPESTDELPYCSGFLSANATEGGSWQVSSNFFLWGPDAPGPGGIAGTGLSFSGSRISESSFRINGVLGAYDTSDGSPIDRGIVEVALLRFSGDPTEFEDVYVESLAGLIAIGVVDPSDVLFSEVVSYSVGPSLNVEYDVDVAGVPDEEIVLFVAEREIVFVPAMSTGAALLLAFLALGALGRAVLMSR